jgi:hypothetical protein
MLGHVWQGRGKALKRLFSTLDFFFRLFGFPMSCLVTFGTFCSLSDHMVSYSAHMVSYSAVGGACSVGKAPVLCQGQHELVVGHCVCFGGLAGVSRMCFGWFIGAPVQKCQMVPTVTLYYTVIVPSEWPEGAITSRSRGREGMTVLGR